MLGAGVLASLPLQAQTDNKVEQEAVAFVERWDNYRRHIKVDSDNEKKWLDEKTFNIQDYMALFPALSVEPGREIRCLYFYNALDGSPCLYAAETGKAYERGLKRHEHVRSRMTRKDKEWISNLLDSAGATGKEKKEFIRQSKKTPSAEPIDFANKSPQEKALMRYAADSLNAASRHVVPEDSWMGYLQYLMFCEFGENFGLFGHRSYNYRLPVCTRARMEELVEENKEKDYINGKQYNEAQMEAALEEDFMPRIELLPDKCVISLHVFGVGTGLYKCTYEVSRKAPHAITLVHERGIVTDGERYIFY